VLTSFEAREHATSRADSADEQDRDNGRIRGPAAGPTVLTDPWGWLVVTAQAPAVAMVAALPIRTRRRVNFTAMFEWSAT